MRISIISLNFKISKLTTLKHNMFCKTCSTFKVLQNMLKIFSAKYVFFICFLCFAKYVFTHFMLKT